VADVNRAAQERSGGYDDPLALNARAVTKGYPAERASVDQDGLDRSLEKLEAVSALNDLQHAACVGGLVALDAGGLYGRTLLGVEGAELHPGIVGIARDFPAEGVELENEVGLRNPADSWVAWHAGKLKAIHGDEAGVNSHARRCERSLAAGMASPDDYDIVALHDASIAKTQQLKKEENPEYVPRGTNRGEGLYQWKRSLSRQK